MSGISLTASMRSNLLSLQNIASQQDIVQNRLATGLKVSSAINNPSSYYTASSLNNRAADLTALLDAMSQGIQTIKAASEAIASGTKFLEQAKAVANQALETAVPAKEWFVGQVGANGAVVETAQELLDAVNAGKETIVVYGKIELINQTIQLQENQKLVGTEYFTNIALRQKDNSRFSQLIFRNENKNAIITASNCHISDFDIDLNTTSTSSPSLSAIVARDNTTDVYVADCNIEVFLGGVRGNASGAIYAYQGSSIILDGKMNITNNEFAIFSYANSNIEIKESADINISARWGISIYSDSKINIFGRVTFNNIEKYAFKLGEDVTETYGNNSLYIYKSAQISSKNDKNDTLFYVGKNHISRRNLISVEKGCIFVQGGQYYKSETIEIETKEFTKLISFSDFLTLANAQKYSVVESSIQNITISDILSKNNSYLLLLKQYDDLISDAFYKGINLLDGQNLKINFNEDRSSKIDVTGVKADSDSLGLKTKEWQTADDVEKSISELEEAISILRGYASQYGNCYSIVTTRQDFTEKLINVLEEGADKLTLADMNQESANMLALQTAQQLAVNSLSLASQASQSILRLF